MFEHHRQSLLPVGQFTVRMVRHVAISCGLIAAALAVGAAGYHFLEGLAWIDAVLNASMLLGGMGPVDPLRTPAGKLFASAYALFSGIFVLAVAGLLFAPVLHRMLHAFHLELDERDDDDEVDAMNT